MFTRGLLCGVFCSLLSAPSLVQAETITGTYGTLYLDGGTYTIEEPANISWLRPANNADVTINGGTIGRIELFTQKLSFYGVTPANGSSISTFAWEGTEIDLHVLDITPEGLESLDRLMAYEGRSGGAKVRLASGQQVHLGFGTPVDGGRPRWNVIYAGDSMMDVGLDGMMGIGELNNVRNTFGSADAVGDLTLDGEVNIHDLNLVRNHFGSAYFPDRAGSAVVPEPSSLAIAGVFAVACLWGWCKRHVRKA